MPPKKIDEITISLLTFLAGKAEKVKLKTLTKATGRVICYLA